MADKNVILISEDSTKYSTAFFKQQIKNENTKLLLNLQKLLVFSEIKIANQD